MSKQGNIETNNICATEDIFEQFAAQEYESGDFITLSELVPSSYTSNEVMDTIIMELPNGGTQDPSVVDMDNITFDADDQQLNVQEINSFASVDSVAHSVMDNVSFANDDQQVGAQEIHSELPNKTYVVYNSSENVEPPKKAASKKRGRKKKSDVTAQKNTAPQDNSDLNYDMVIGEDDFLDPVPPTPTRRGVRSLKTSVVKDPTPKVSPKPTSPKQVGPPKKPRGRPPKIVQPELTTSTVETKRKYGRKRKSDSDTSPLFTSSIETKQNNEQKHDPNMHGIVLNNDNENCDITSSSNVDMKSDEFLDNVVKEVIVTNEETKVVDNNVNDAPDMCSEIVGEVEIMTSGNDDIDNIPLGQLSKVINKPFPMAPTNDYAYNKSIAEKTDAKQFCTKKVLKNVKKGRPKKKAMNVDDDGMDDVCLSKLKKSFNEPVKENETIVNEQHPDITTTVQENVEMDTAISSIIQENVEIDTATPAIDSQVDVSGETSKRPVRRRAKKILHYEQDSEHSDEDPFANVELSDDEPSSGKKGGRYYSDDEYIPGMENDEKPDKLSDSEAEDDFEFIRKQKKRKLSKSPKKKIIEDTMSAKADALDDDIEGCIETSVIKLTEGEQSSWGTTKEFENFLANKVGSDVFIKKSKSSKSQIAPLEIPVLDPNEPKTNKVETSSQTNVVHTKNSFAQTESQNDLSMKEQVKLTPVQSEKACEFLSNIVRTTAELGQLMTQKSEDFIEKKINTTHVTDTLKMDYCVKKSFLLFKLAKHNLIQMEEDLARQYEDFLSSQKLIQYREKKKVIEAKVKNESDSDCEIVEILSDAKKPSNKKEEKSSFNPKTVFLNKELSIKIAKKQTPSVSTETKTSAKNMNIKGRHTVWINDSIMVKKVKPNQSFLAQDSRNKKPPDSQFITLKMVNDFFKSYYRQKVLSTCAPFVECNWFTSNKSYCCYYSTEIVPATSSKCTLIANNTPIVGIPDSSTRIKIPKPLLTLCVIVLKKLINLNNKLDVRKVLNQSDSGDTINCINNTDCSELCIPNSINYNDKNIDDVISSKDLKNVNAESQINNKQVKSLSILCLQVLQNHIYWQTDPSCNNGDTLVNFVCEDRIYEEKINTYTVSQKFNSNVKSLSTLCLQELQSTIPYESTMTKVALSDTIFDCYNDSIDDGSKDLCYVENYNNYEDIDCNQTENIYLNNVNSLKTICHRKIVELIFNYPENFGTHLEPTIINSYTLRPVNESRNEEVKSLFSLCTRYLQNTLYPYNKQQTRVNNFGTHYEPTIINTYTLRPVNESRNEEVKSLFSLCTRYLQNIQYHYSKEKIKVRNIPSYTPKTLSSLALKSLRKKMMHEPNSINQKRKKKPQVQTLSRLCFELISSILYKEEFSILNKKKNISHHKHSTVHPLKKLCLEKVTNFMGLPYVNADLERNSNGLSITINEINTVSEEFFNNEYDSYREDGAYDNTDFGVENDEESHGEIENNYDDWENDGNIPNEGTEWATHIQMGDLRTCGDARKSIENVNNTSHEEAVSINPLEPSILSNIKQEVCEDAHYMPNVMTIIKNEPDLDEAHLNDTEPLHRITKTEHSFLESTENIKPVLLNSYDVNAFEKFVSSNKLMYSMADGGSQDEEEGHGRGFPRFRRQYEPDLDGDEDNFDNLGLLVPQTVEQAKDRLMNSSSDEEGKSKKNDKRKNLKKRGRPKKVNKEIVPIKSKNGDDVATLTKKMKERLRQEDNQENESEEDEIPLILRRDKSKKISNTNKEIDKVETSNQNNIVEKDKDSQATSYEIQCNNIDSTENVETIEERNVRRSLRKKLHQRSDEVSNEDSSSINTGVSEDVESSHCEESNEQENPKLKQDNSNLDLRRSLRKNKAKKEDSKSETLGDKCDKSTLNSNDAIQSALIIDAAAAETSQIEEQNNEHSEPESYTDAVDMDEPIELLECEPTLPVFDTQADTKRKTKVKKTQKVIDDTSASDKDKSKEIVIRNGWECYPVDRSDAKLYNYASVSLEKLPESFVETYFKYINLDKDKDEDDIEIDRLTNLQSLNREKVKSKEVTRRSKTKKTSSSDPSEGVTNIKLELEAENADELTASEDEIDNTDEMLPPVQENDAENYLAKSLLMGDNDSETEEAKGSKIPEESKEKRRPGPKSKTKLKTPISNVKKEDGDILLTADRMMNSELALLHAPVTSLTDQMIKEDKDFVKKNKQHKNKTSSKSHTTTVHIRKDDDSSSEEEKQWVTTKEKLLRRLEKKQENHIDDAKRAKIVSEYIEKRREDGPVSQSVLRRPRRGRSRRDRRKLLERRKQMKVLSRELCGEDGSSSKRYSHSYGKGRRNIRKVIDKKSLARNTVLANIEEFERKRRLSMREAQLKETLGFEEDVNVVVINDELCLEYDFDNNQPAVTVHPFFTKVMKAHQYEGVKFMWDACFETVETVQNGGTGGGCILAHCMGLGKTLQVLALLHTVLTHPGVAMQRVLVCCPLSTVLNWVDEIHKWIGPVTNQIKVFELSKLKKTYERAYQLEDWYSGGGIFIIGYELFRSLSTLDPVLDDVRPTIVNKIRTALLDPGPDIIICDEGHLLKNDMSVLAVAMSRVVTKRRIVLTGTPMQNNLREYYCMVNFIKPNLLGTYSEYSNRFENPIMNGQHRDSMEEDIKLMKQRTHILHKVLEGCLQRQEASVLYPYLPKKYEYTVFISLTPCQWDLYKHYISQTRGMYKGNKHNILKDFHVLQKIWSHPQVLHHFQTKGRDEEKLKAEKIEDELLRDELAASEDIKPTPTDVWWLQYLDGGTMLDDLDSSNKFLVVFRLLDECVALGDKVLIFSTSLYALDALEYFLRRINGWSLGHDYYRLDGSVPAEVRQKWCREFNDESNTHTKLFLISTRAGCLGLNMTAANRVIILDTSWNPAHDIQSIFRVYRFGQKKDCFIYRLVALGTMEQKMYERSVTKQAVACRVVDEQQIDRHYNMAELSELYNYDEEGLSVDAGLAAGVRDAALLRVAAALQGRAGALHAVREHDSLLRDTDARLPEHERAAAWQQFQQEHAEEQTLVKIPKKVKLKINETKEPPTNPTESIADPKPSRKRGRPRKFSPDRSEPSTSKPTFSITQEIIVDKIRELLVQHNAVQATQADIARMIGDVRQYIVDPTSDIGSNPLVKEIADVLLRQNMPPLTDCIESRNTDEPEMILGDSDTRNQDDNVQTLSDSEATLSETEFEEKKRKKSKTDDDYVPPLYYKMDENFVSGKSKGRGRPRKNFEKTPPQKTRTTPRNKDATVNVQTDDYSELVGVHTIDDGINEDTIDISDDDTVVQKPAPNSRKTTQKATKTPEVTKKPPATANELPSDILLPAKTAVEAIPLPKSLLTDKKFIKIVAHMYVSSSPILDEDAATRAAEYSTAKALRELNETGDKIVSGNLHEIALKVYGPEALKRLNLREDFETKSKSYEVTANYNDNSSSSQSSGSKKKPAILKKKTQKPTKTQEEAPSNVAESNTTQIILEPEQEIPEPVVAPLKKVVITPMSNNSFDFKVTSGPSNNHTEAYQVPTSTPCIVPTAVREEIIPASAPSTERVVPVGMFTGAGTIAVPSSREESILPDDDDVMVIPLDPPLSAGLSKQLDDLLIPRQQDTVLQPQQFLISSGPPSSVGPTLAYSTSTEPTANPAPANSTLANPHLVSMLAKPTPAIPTPANPTPANPAQPNPSLANSIVPIMVTDPPVAKTKPRTLSKSLPKDANNKMQTSKVLPPLPPTAKGKRTYLIKTSDLEAALSKYPEGQGPTIHLDSGKVMVPVQFIKQSKNQGEGGNLVITKMPTSNQNIVVPLPTSTKQAKPAAPVLYDSICLDSDEEDTGPPPQKKPEPIVGPSRLDLSQLKKAEPKPKDTKQTEKKATLDLSHFKKAETKPKDIKQPEIKATPTLAKTEKPKTLSDLKLGFDKDKKKITFIPSNPAAKKPETPKKDTKAESIRPNSMVFDDGASIEFVSLFDNITPTTPAKSTPPAKPTPTSKPTPPAKPTPTSKPTTPAKSTPPAKSILLPKSATPAKSTTPAKPTPSAKSTVPAKSTPPAKSIPVTDKRVSEKPKTDTPKNRPKPKSKQTAPQTDLGMIDLTHFDVEPKNNTSTKGKSISGTSKDIFITNAGKLSTDKTKILNKEIDLTGGDVTKVINIKPSTSSGSSSVKRTKKPEISTPVKKPKLETKSKPSSALKSLMDLTFDDIDDIVELE